MHTGSVSGTLTTVGIDHARLSYHYLDLGDMDGYASLFEADAVVRIPGKPTIRGRDRLERLHSGPHGGLHSGLQSGLPAPRHCEHLVHDVFGAGNRVAAVGSLVDGITGVQVDFADTFTISDSGLIRSQVRYFFADPRG
ncbi:nuclear transport factor 2 family protein [Amycolatopsis nigrescens]|uniref:nuclear transport factor 2 family protein n=1 Tax=Amycolatopsis nigrescens TaxID=381445 RepID=UPI00037AF0A2|nr:nuclear transport factor 2 family protein [Amycolatopsis nigrescens]